MNVLDVIANDISSAYLQAPSSQEDYIICGPEFGLEKTLRNHSSVVNSMEERLLDATSDIICVSVCVIQILYHALRIPIFG